MVEIYTTSFHLYPCPKDVYCYIKRSQSISPIVLVKNKPGTYICCSGGASGARHGVAIL